MTHDELVRRGVYWLRRTKRCPVVCVRPRPINYELPDVIGWPLGGFSHLIECKASRSDFLADRKKPSPGRSSPTPPRFATASEKWG